MSTNLTGSPLAGGLPGSSPVGAVPPGALPPAIVAEIALLTQMGEDYRVTRAIWIASLAILLYDYALCLGPEVEYLKKGRFGWIKLLYIVNRYWPIANLMFDNISLAIVNPPHDVCIFFFNWFPYSALPTHTTIGIILILRLYAMYNRNKKLLWGLLALMFSELVIEIAIIGPIVAKMAPMPLPPLFSGCVPANIEGHAWAYWVPMVVFESTLFILSAIKSVQVARAETTTSRVLVVLLRDSILYFGGVLSVILSNFIMWAGERQSLFTVVLGTAFAAHSILGCRMLLNIHDAVQPTFANVSITTQTIVHTDAHSYQMRPLRSGVTPTPSKGRYDDFDSPYSRHDGGTLVHVS